MNRINIILTTAVLLVFATLCHAGPAERTYTQEFQVTFATADEAAKAKLAPTPVLDGKMWALSARWDDNHPTNLLMRDAMAKHGLKGTFYLTHAVPGDRFGTKYVAQLLKDGFSIGAHSMSHGFLPTFNANQIFIEVLGVRVEREAQADMPVVSFAFSFGAWQSKEPAAGPRSTDALKRAGLHHNAYHYFLRNNPDAGDYFSTCLLIQPGDAVINRPKFETNLGKLFTNPKPYQEISRNITLATHARQTGKAWEDLDALFADLVKRESWWHCNQNEYAAYEKQYRLATIERVSASGATATYRITRPVPADLGAAVPLTLEVTGGAVTGFTMKSAKADAAKVDAKTGKSLINLPHDANQTTPMRIDVVDNVNNSEPSADAGKSADFPGLSAWLHRQSDGRLSLRLNNAGDKAFTDVHVTLRLPLQYKVGLQTKNLADLPAGKLVEETFDPGVVSDDPAFRDGSVYHVAEIDFRLGGQLGRMYATTTVHQPSDPRPCVRDASRMLGPIMKDQFKPEQLAAWSKSGAAVTNLGSEQTKQWFTAAPADRQRFSGERLVLFRDSKEWVEACKAFNPEHAFLATLDFKASEAGAVTIESELPVGQAFLNGAAVDVAKPVTIAAGDNRLVVAFDIGVGRIYYKAQPAWIELSGGAITYVPVATIVAAAAAAPEDSAKGWAPFVIPAAVPSDSPIAFRGEPIAADSPRVVVKDGKFMRGDRRLRVWGMNFSAGSNMPTHEEAPGIAARLEAFGVNSVRIHHLDYEHGRFPQSIYDANDPMSFSAEGLDRLDFFIDQLAKHGIHVNLNLHVSRLHSRHLKLPDSSATGLYDKIVDLFTPQLIEAQKKYARDLLTHVNKYRGVTYAKDAAVAFVEINNEDSFFVIDGEAKLRAMHPFYAGILKERYNAWLKSEYGTTTALAAAWKNPAGEAAAEDVRKLALPGKSGSWTLGLAGGAAANVLAIAEPNASRIVITSAGSAVWHVEFSNAGLAIERDRHYELRFRARADGPRDMTVSVKQADSPWTALGLRKIVKLTNEWQSFVLPFDPPMAEANGRVSMMLGQAATAVELADVELVSRSPAGLGPNESIEQMNVDLFADGDTQPRQADRMRFLAVTEKAYYDDFYRYIRTDLKCDAIITGTMVYGPLGLWAQSDMDFIDHHTYWAHPQFPGGKWSQKTWTIDHKAFVNQPDESMLFHNIAGRLAGKPMTMSEYNHPAPNDYQAECVPLVATIAAAQDWDGVWLFGYAHMHGEWANESFLGFFDMQQNPSKWAFMPAAAAIFRDGAIEPLREGKVWPLTRSARPIDDLIVLQQKHGMWLLNGLSSWNVTRQTLLDQRVMVRLSAGEPTDLPAIAGSTTKLELTTGRFQATGRSAIVRMETAQTTAPPLIEGGGFGVLTATALDGQSLAQSRKVLFTLGGKSQNTDMKFTANRKTVSTNWGVAPVRIEPLAARWLWNVPGSWQWTMLGADTMPLGAGVTEPGENGATLLQFKPDAGTMWHLLTTKSGS